MVKLVNLICHQVRWLPLQKQMSRGQLQELQNFKNELLTLINLIKRFVLSILMGFCWLYYMIGVVSLFAILIGIFLSVFFPNMPYASNVLPNLIDLLNTLGENGITGLIALAILVGQYFLAYYLYNFLKEYRENL